MQPNRHVLGRRPRSSTQNGRVLALTPDEAVADWVEDELRGQHIGLQISRTVEGVIDALIYDPPPRPQIFVVDLDAVSATDALELHAIRERGWFGMIYAIGIVPPELRISLNIERVLWRPLAPGTLGNLVADAGLMRATTRIAKIM